MLAINTELQKFSSGEHVATYVCSHCIYIKCFIRNIVSMPIRRWLRYLIRRAPRNSRIVEWRRALLTRASTVDPVRMCTVSEFFHCTGSYAPGSMEVSNCPLALEFVSNKRQHKTCRSLCREYSHRIWNIHSLFSFLHPVLISPMYFAPIIHYSMSLTIEEIIIIIPILSLCAFLLWHAILYGRNSPGPFLWPCVGFLPAIVVNIERLYDWTLPFFEVCFTSHT